MFINYKSFCLLGVKWGKTVLLQNHMLCLFSNSLHTIFFRFSCCFMMFISANTILLVFYSGWTQMYIFKILRHTHDMPARKFEKHFSIKVRKFAACVQHSPIYEETIQKDSSTKYKKNCFVSGKFVNMRLISVCGTVSPHNKNHFTPRFLKRWFSCSFLWPPYSNVKQSRRYLLQYFGAKYQ